MKKSLLKRVVALGAVVGAVGSVALTSPAHAGPTRVLTSAGSDTIEGFDIAVLRNHDAGNYVIEAQQQNAMTVPGDAACGALTYHSPPASGEYEVNGSSAGIRAVNGTQAGVPLNCVDIGRSSRDKSATDPAVLEFHGFALDSVGWASPSLQAPASITLTQLQDIYRCNITNWNQLPGGGSGPIQRYLPQNNSGTRLTFVNKVLGFDPTTFTSCAAPIEVQENTGKQFAQASYQQAIVAYSAGKWAYQANNRANPSVDLRNDTRMGLVGGVAPVTYSANAGQWVQNSAVTNEANSDLTSPSNGFGTRKLYHVLNPTQEAASYNEARALVGPGSPLCSNAYVAQIRAQGFLPLPNVAGSTCRVAV